MKNKILFIVPPLSVNTMAKFANHQIPLGFLYMANILEKANFIVKILDCPLYYQERRKVDEETIKVGLSFDKIEKEIKEFKPDIVGVSCSYSMFESDSFEIIDFVKKINKDIFIAVGGAHTSSNPKFVLRNKNINLAVIGEGELTMLDIAKRFKSNKDMKSIKGTAVIVNKKFKINKPRELIRNLDEIEPAWHHIDFKKYFEHPDNSAAVIRTPSINIITSRGCPGNCAFCSVHTVWGRKWRAISAKKVLEQIEFLYREKGIRHFRINDDNLTIDKKRLMAICRGIISRKLDIKWDTPSGVAMWTLDEEMLNAMKESGYYRITFGIESGSQESLKYIGKNVDLEKIRKIINYCHNLGIWVGSFFIIGLPYEKKEDIKKTEDFIINSGLNFPFIFIAQPYPGTRMYEDFKNMGYLKKGLYELSNSTITKYQTKNFSANELNDLRRKIYIKFYSRKLLSYFNPATFYREFLSKIRNKEDFNYALKIIGGLITNFLY